MKIKIGILISILYIFTFQQIFAQIKKIGIPLITNFYPHQYDAGSQNWGITQDERGYIYIANNVGILIFDGNQWTEIKMPNSGEVRSIYKDNKGRIWVGGLDEIGYLITDSVNQIKFRSIVHKIPKQYRNFAQAWNVYELEQKIIIQTSNYIFIIKDNHCKVFESDNQFHTSYLVNNTLYIRKRNVGLLEYKKDTLQLIKDGEFFADIKIYSILPIDNNKILVATRSNGLYTFDGTKIEKWNIPITQQLIDAEIYCGLKIDSLYFLYGTLKNGIYVLDTKGNIVQNINKKKGLTSDIVYDMFLDKFNNLWLANGYGINVVEIMSPFTLLSNFHGISGRTILMSVMDNYFYIGSEQDLFYYDWNLHKIENNTTDFYFNKIEKFSNQVWYSIIIDNHIYFLVNDGIIKVTKNSSELVVTNNSVFWKIIELPNAKNKYLVGTNQGFVVVEYKDKLGLKNLVKGFESSARYFEFQGDHLWLSVTTEGVYRLKFNDKFDSIVEKKYYGTENGFPSELNIIPYFIDNQLLFATEAGFYLYDNTKDSFVVCTKYSNFFDNKTMDNILGIDKLNNLWLSDSSGFLFFNLDTEKNILNRKISKKLSDKFVTYMLGLDSNNLFFSTKDGILHYDYNINKDATQKYNAVISKIENINEKKIVLYDNYINKDSILSSVQNPEDIQTFKYYQNSFRFTVSALFFEETSHIKYSFYLDGFDKTWTDFASETTKEYTNLPAGRYIFKVKAINIYLQESNIGEYIFIISKPWYKTYWAYLIYVLLLIILFYILLKINTRRLDRNNRILEQKIRERTIFIEMQKAELEQQKEEILTQSEELEIVNKELLKLSTIASETDNAILVMNAHGDFEWVNAAFTKIFGYSLEELINNVSKNIIGERTPEYIKAKVRTCIDKKITVEYELLTRNKKGNNIWIKTTLTPILDAEGEIKNIVAIDSDITKIKEAEHKIYIQNENITGSIRYALTIQNTILPEREDLNKLFDNFIIYRPKDIVSGDFYWMTTAVKNSLTTNSTKNNPELSPRLVETLGKYVFIGVADCTGHGVPGAFMSLIGSRLLNEIVNQKNIYSPKNILEQLDSRLKYALKQNQNNNRDGMDISICRLEVMLIDNQVQIKLLYSGAKSPILIYETAKQLFHKTSPTRRNIGGHTNYEPDFTNTEIMLSNNDYIFMYSDGLKDQSNAAREKFGSSQIIKVLQSSIHLDMSAIKSAIENELDNWQGHEEQRDDITFLGLKLTF